MSALSGWVKADAGHVGRVLGPSFGLSEVRRLGDRGSDRRSPSEPARLNGPPVPPRSVREAVPPVNPQGFTPMVKRDGSTGATAGPAELLERVLARESPEGGVSYATLVEHQAETEAKYRNLVEQLPCVVYLGRVRAGRRVAVRLPADRARPGLHTEGMARTPIRSRPFTHPDDLAAPARGRIACSERGEPFEMSTGPKYFDAVRGFPDEATAVLDTDGHPILAGPHVRHHQAPRPRSDPSPWTGS